MTTRFIFEIQNALILAIFYFGIYKKSNRNLHPKIMITGIIWDILLILQIELDRSAIGKAIQVTQNKALLNFHVSIALMCVVLYFALIHSGRGLLAGNGKLRKRHKTLGIITIMLRTLVFITSFLIVEQL